MSTPATLCPHGCKLGFQHLCLTRGTGLPSCCPSPYASVTACLIKRERPPHGARWVVGQQGKAELSERGRAEGPATILGLLSLPSLQEETTIGNYAAGAQVSGKFSFLVHPSSFGPSLCTACRCLNTLFFFVCVCVCPGLSHSIPEHRQVTHCKYNPLGTAPSPRGWAHGPRVQAPEKNTCEAVMPFCRGLGSASTFLGTDLPLVPLFFPSGF